MLEYEMDYNYNKEDADTFTITAPESLAGIGGRIAGTDNGAFSLQYDRHGAGRRDAAAYRARRLRHGLFCLLSDLRNSASRSSNGQNRLRGPSCLFSGMRRTVRMAKIEKQVWLTENGRQLVCAELYADGKRVLTIQVMSYQET